ncbi:MAG: DUF2400 family protein [Polyangiaceae bacterium]|nr:DUF2400 family protein [Polyangiaceae bacterium]
MLSEVERATDAVARVARDPVSLVRAAGDPREAELVAVLASSLAFGNVTTILAKIREVLARAGGPLVSATRDPRALGRSLRGFKHRLYRGEHVAALLVGAARVQRQRGSLGAALASHLERAPLQEALARWVDELRAHGLDGLGDAGARHLLPDPRAGGSSKRLLLLLRWMARPPGPVDVGLWSGLIPASRLLIPLDTHLFKLSKNLGLTSRGAPSWRAAEEITRALTALDAADPTRFDFPLCHLGMVQGCPSRRDAARCHGCGVKPLCVHWRGAARAPPGSERS